MEIISEREDKSLICGRGGSNGYRGRFENYLGGKLIDYEIE